MRSKDNFRGYEKDLIKKGVKLVKRNIPIPEGCWMCGRTEVKMSKEHVIPDWLQKHYNIGDYIMRQAHVDSKGFVLSTREVKFASLRQGRVCEKNCNYGWMRKLEDDFAKVFKEGWKVGQAKEPLIFARWIAKTLTIINISQPRRIMIDEDGRHGLSNSEYLPEGWQVYIYETDTAMSELVSWEQGGAIEIGTKEYFTVKNKETFEQVYVGCIKVDNLVGVAYYTPKEVKSLSPIFPFKMMWPDVAGELPVLPYGGMLFNQCLINIDLENSDWRKIVERRKKAAIDILNDNGIRLK